MYTVVKPGTCYCELIQFYNVQCLQQQQVQCFHQGLRRLVLSGVTHSRALCTNQQSTGSLLKACRDWRAGWVTGIGWRADFASWGAMGLAEMMVWYLLLWVVLCVCACVNVHTTCQNRAVCDGNINTAMKSGWTLYTVCAWMRIHLCVCMCWTEL